MHGIFSLHVGYNLKPNRIGGKNINNFNDNFRTKKLIAAAALSAALLSTAVSVLSGTGSAEIGAPSPAASAAISPASAAENIGAAAENNSAEGDAEGGAVSREDGADMLLAPDQPRLSADETSGIMNVLLIGTDERLPDSDDQGRGDVTLLCSLDMDTGKVKLVSFERSTAVPWPGHGDVMLTNSYSYGGAELTTSAVSSCFRVDIAGYIHMDFDGFKEIIDALGGVDIDLSAEEAQALTEDSLTEIWFSEGTNHLDGDGALRYCRLRRIDDNWQRVARQRNTVQAILTQAKGMSLTEMTGLARTALEHVDTNLSKRQLAALLLSAPKFVGAEAEQLTIPDRENISVYDGVDESVTGCDYQAESERLRSFLYGE